MAEQEQEGQTYADALAERGILPCPEHGHGTHYAKGCPECERERREWEAPKRELRNQRARQRRSIKKRVDALGLSVEVMGDGHWWRWSGFTCSTTGLPLHWIEPRTYQEMEDWLTWIEEKPEERMPSPVTAEELEQIIRGNPATPA
jgi:hypothetical protein